MRQEYDSTGLLARTITVHAPAYTSRRTEFRFDTTRYAYDPRWRAVNRIISPERDTVRMTYDAYGRRDSVIDARGNVTTFVSRNDGLVSQIVEPLVPTTVYAYDSVTLNLTSITRGNATTSYIYSGNGSDVYQVLDPVNAQTTYYYDALKRVVRVDQQSDSGPVTTQYGYIDSLRVRTQTDPLGRVARWTMDAGGRLIQRCVVAGWCEATAYGDQVNPTRMSLRNGVLIDHEFDAAGRVTRKLSGVGGYEPPDTVEFAYDQAGNLVQADNKYSRVFRAYDAYGRLVAERQSVRRWNAESDGSYAFHGPTMIRHDYDRNGRRRATYLEALGRQQRACYPRLVDYDEVDPCQQPFRVLPTDSITFAYDRNSNLTSLTSTIWRITAGSGNNQWTYVYDAQNRPDAATVPRTTGSYPRDWVYDAQGHLTRHFTGGSSGGFIDETLVPDVMGRTVTYSGNYTRNYEYDMLGRLKHSSGTGGGPAETFLYDKGGNRVTDTRWTYIYNDRGQLAEKYEGNGGAQQCRMRYVYDENGNQTLEDLAVNVQCSNVTKREMGYDRDNRMVTMIVQTSAGRGTRTFWYDGLGRRVMMRADDLESSALSTDAGTWRYFWADDNVLVQTRSVLDTIDGDYEYPSIRRTNGALGGRGQWFLNGPGADNVLGAWNKNADSTSRQVFYKDYRGSTVWATDAAGANIGNGASAFLAFGGGTGSTGAGAGEPGFNSAPSSGGLVYMRNRWYDPNNGRFTQQDPIGFAGGSNLYAYAGNDPITYSDPYGLCPNPLAPGLGSLQCVLEDAIGGARQAWNNALGAPGQAVGAWKDFLRAKDEMDNNPIQGLKQTDKFYHFRANCEATARGPAGEAAAESISDIREVTDRGRPSKNQPEKASEADQEANRAGRAAGRGLQDHTRDGQVSGCASAASQYDSSF